MIFPPPRATVDCKPAGSLRLPPLCDFGGPGIFGVRESIYQRVARAQLGRLGFACMAPAANEDPHGLLRDPCQVRVHLIEARQLRGTGAALPNPLAKVQLSAGTVKRMQATEMFQDTSSVYFDETKIFNEQLSKEEFQNGQLTVHIQDDQGFFSNSLIGETVLDLTAVHDSPGHEMFGKWLPLLNPTHGSVLQGFVRFYPVIKPVQSDYTCF